MDANSDYSMSPLPSRPHTPSTLPLRPPPPPVRLRRLSRSRDSIAPVTSQTPLLLRPLRRVLDKMSSYGAIGDDHDELDRLLSVTTDPPTAGARPIPGAGANSSMRRVASERIGGVGTSNLSPDVRRREAGIAGSYERRGPYLYTGGLGLGDGLGGSTSSLAGAASQGGVSPTTAVEQHEAAAHRAHNMAIRYRLFNRLDPGGTTLRMPDHVIPPEYFSILPFDDFMDSSGKQNSFVTIFSLWNTMMGTSLLAMPWAIQQAGLVLGIVLMLLLAGLCFYTANLVLQSPKGLTLDVDSASAEFSDVCRYLYGKWGERAAVVFSVVVLFGGVMVYWVLMSNFLYYTGTVVYEALQANSTTIPVMENKTFTCDVYCPQMVEDQLRDYPWEAPIEGIGKLLGAEGTSSFDALWQLRLTVPIYLAFLCFPLLNFKSPTFFTKFNVLGTVSVFYLLSFTGSKLVECGFNMNFVDPTSEHYVHLFSPRFPALTGTLTLSYFIHNAVLTIMRNQKNPENNTRDLSIGYSLAAFCYVFIGFTFYAGFPVKRDCISDNFLNNFGTGDVMSATARLFLLFQMLTVLPLLMFLIRTQFFYATTGKAWPGVTKVVVFNAVIIAMAATVAIVYPKVGSILRYVGSFSGLVYVFALPVLVYIKKQKLEGGLSRRKLYVLYGIMSIGVVNLIAQFVI